MRGTLVDSNILVYNYDASETAKQARAFEVLDALINRRLAFVSVQCLGEFFSTATRKLLPPLSLAGARMEVERFARDCKVLGITGLAVQEACRGVEDHQMSYWDALIWSVARLNEVSVILTEDGQHGRLIEGVRYQNPFHPDFDLQALVAV